MSKRFIMILVIALLVVSFAAARVINFSIGPAFSFYTGKFSMDDSGSTVGAYKGTGLGLDTAFDLTFGERAELYFQDSILFSGKAPSETPDPDFDFATIDFKTHIGFEFAVVTTPVKVSVGAGFAAELIAVAGLEKPALEEGDLALILNAGVGGTAKVEYQFANNWSAYFKVYADYMFATGFTGSEIPVPKGYEPPLYVGKYGNFSIDGSIGIILHF